MIQYRNATIEDMNEVAQVHILTQPEYFTSTLGVDLLSKFYAEFLREDNLFVVAYDDEKNKIVGFCMGNYYGSCAEKLWEKKYRKQIMKRLFIKCIQLNRLAISRSFRRVKGLLIKKKSNNKEIYFSHLLSLGVLLEYRGRHIASALIDEFESRCLQSLSQKLPEGGATCTIGAYKWNIAGKKLYEYKGYKVFEESNTKLKFTKDLLSYED